jgi:cytochrome b6-f complex iron-sulfur subunit
VRGPARRSAERYIDRLLRQKRPGSFAPSDEEAALVKAAIELKAADPEAAAPRPEFVNALRERLANSEAGPAPSTAPSTTAGAHHAPRRWMLAAGALTATGVAAGAVAERLLGPADAAGTPAAAPRDTVISPTAGAWQTVTTSAELTSTSVIPFDLGSVNGFLYRAGGRVRAVSGTCTHQACRLGLDAPRDILVCPCHGATFTLAGANLAHPNRTNGPLPALPRLLVREQDGHVQIYAPPAAG